MFTEIFVFICMLLSLVSTELLRNGIKREGDLCLDGSGECTLLVNCPPALKELRERRRHQYDRCGFKGRDEIVCCPLVELTTSTLKDIKQNTTPDPTDVEERSPVRKSTKACDEYASQVGSRLDYQIIGGEDAQLGEFPHMVAIGFEVSGSDNLEYSCGGSLITLNYILTAAHCLVKRDRQAVQVKLGKIDFINNTDNVVSQDFPIENITIHPEYSNLRKVNDIALIKIKGTVITNKNVHPACLYHKSDDPRGLVTTGWGITEPDGVSSAILQKVTLIAVNIFECNKTYLSSPVGKPILQTQICAGSDDGTLKDSCLGDSGGPLQAQVKSGSSIYSIVGVTSYGKICAGPYPGIYTRVHSYTDWIEKIVWP